MKFLFTKWNIFQKCDFFNKNRRLKSNLDPKVYQFLYFIYNLSFDKTSELWQISCIVLHLVEIQDSL